ncbi:DUF2180 family protein [Methanohalophilus portucalensis]|uniref:DUF2180 family protein n=2 Tax=Methanohalophilus portucalensis TaxID=39664 RepID=A0A1L9C4M0_9EURY|nr:DUF2180 family protein [Methanohalophilus portucalensis]ATU07719.1 hypothetical protein BKM01_02360 [Methanohalophilus portucalensis]OJH49475.1 hypothetical protein MPF_1342 [Methanohalophilus portucalensis FDF-1]RNI11431.1 DUF2180 family protein [Methanohalophilus portucalensis FDF-1]SMH40702.1 hypothetical protein SAMN06264941_1533 [Methanohalophilus portucalensis FDF-1]
MMKCYDCAEEGKTEEASVVCIVCGKGLCSAHAKEMPLQVSVGKPPNVKHLHKGLPHFMCNYCLENTVEDACV